MAHCINCDCLISDNPGHSDYCSDECESEFTSGADQEVLAAAKAAGVTSLVSTRSNINSGANCTEYMKNHKHTTAPDVKTFIAGMSDAGNAHKVTEQLGTIESEKK